MIRYAWEESLWSLVRAWKSLDVVVVRLESLLLWWVAVWWEDFHFQNSYEILFLIPCLSNEPLIFLLTPLDLFYFSPIPEEKNILKEKKYF